jgi:hypothetical protein
MEAPSILGSEVSEGRKRRDYTTELAAPSGQWRWLEALNRQPVGDGASQVEWFRAVPPVGSF